MLANCHPGFWKGHAHLIKQASRTLFAGSSRPEPLRHALSGYGWRRSNEQHRMVYEVVADSLFIAQRRYHYCVSAAKWGCLRHRIALSDRIECVRSAAKVFSRLEAALQRLVDRELSDWSPLVGKDGVELERQCHPVLEHLGT